MELAIFGAVCVIVVLYFLWSNEKFMPYPYVLSNGYLANTDLEATIDADWNGINRNRTGRPPCPARRPDNLTKIVNGRCTTFDTTALLYEAMGIPNIKPVATPTCVFVNDIGYMYKN
jgi:hypothetical protein